MKRILLTTLSFLTCISLFAKPDPIDIEFGPWVTNVTDTSATILWTTKTQNLGWVEITDQSKGVWSNRNPQFFYQVFAGRWCFGKLHRVDVTGLRPGQEYKYRVCGRTVVDDSEPQEMVYGMDKISPVYTVKTFDSLKPSCRFSMVNDMHNQRDKYSALINQLDPEATDFVVLGGDLLSAGNYVTDTLVKYDISPISKLAGKMPVMFVRGNHEGRGNNWKTQYEIFPTRTPGQFYYTFREGPVAFLVLDAGETKPVVSKTFMGQSYYREYLEQELKWAENAVREPSFAEAPVKVCLIHVPMTGRADATDYNCQDWMAEHFIPMLNASGIDMVINAHTHKYSVIPAGEFGNDFPMVINGNMERLQFDCDGETISIRTFDQSGTEVHSFQHNRRAEPHQ